MTYLDTFFEEKQLPSELFKLTDTLGTLHIMDTEAIIEIIKSAPEREQKVIADTLRKIDFVNGDVMKYLKFLAQAFVDNLAKESV